MTPQAFAADLATIPAMDDLTVRICSGGGDVWAAQAIGAMLENRLGTVTAQIEGICASAATIVASHCKVVKAAEDATYMIHPIKVNPNGFVDMEGLKQLMDALTVMRTNVLNQYAKKTGHTVEEVAAWMDATSWWTAAEAKENGFIDEITESNQTAKIENRNGALFVNSIAVPGTFDDAPEFVRNRAVVAPATTDGFVNNTDPAGKPDKNDGGNDMEFKNADELRNGCPDLVKEIVDEAHAEAQKQERDRLAAIETVESGGETARRVKIQITGADETYIMHQVGVYGRLNDDAETLLFIMQDARGVEVPSTKVNGDFEIELSALLAVSNKANISITVDPQVQALMKLVKAEIEKHNAKAEKSPNETQNLTPCISARLHAAGGICCRRQPDFLRRNERDGERSSADHCGERHLSALYLSEQ